MVLAGVTWSKTKSATANWRNRWRLLPVEIQQGVICHTSVHCLKVITTVAAALRCVTFSGQSRCCDGNSTETFPGAWGLNLIGPFVYIKVKLIDTIFVNRICHHCCPPSECYKRQLSVAGRISFCIQSESGRTKIKHVLKFAFLWLFWNETCCQAISKSILLS